MNPLNRKMTPDELSLYQQTQAPQQLRLESTTSQVAFKSISSIDAKNTPPSLRRNLGSSNFESFRELSAEEFSDGEIDIPIQSFPVYDEADLYIAKSDSNDSLFELGNLLEELGTTDNKETVQDENRRSGSASALKNRIASIKRRPEMSRTAPEVTITGKKRREQDYDTTQPALDAFTYTNPSFEKRRNTDPSYRTVTFTDTPPVSSKRARDAEDAPKNRMAHQKAPTSEKAGAAFFSSIICNSSKGYPGVQQSPHSTAFSFSPSVPFTSDDDL